ncbi:MAG: phosphatase PAP2 family protein [Muribaculaceae bacterium]|nr:phosphatase PAP2 family protein [Muribaculaceae bacterium]
MKKTIGLIFIIALGSSVINAQDHSTNPDKYFLNYGETPNSLQILPPPPSESSARFAYDKEQYEWGKSLRNTDRGVMAIKDAELGADWVNEVFGEAFGYKITPQTAPELCRLIENMRQDAGDLATRDAKNHYMRTRPFVYWNEPTSTPGHEGFLRTNGSYPSGHTATGWAVALILAEINPSRATEILNRGLEFGQSRVIVGAHYQSDVDMGRIVAAGVVATLHSNKNFAKQLKKAKKEFKRLAKHQSQATES